jgi:hypothetical protein
MRISFPDEGNETNATIAWHYMHFGFCPVSGAYKFFARAFQWLL